jgi:hypothetical protein
MDTPIATQERRVTNGVGDLLGLDVGAVGALVGGLVQFLRIYSTKRERRDLSACLKFMGVITFADLADENGHEIPADRLTGDWRAESEFDWPRQPCPEKKAWATLRRFVRETLYFETSP